MKKLLLAGLLCTALIAKEAAVTPDAAASAAQANNPLANMIALNFQDYYSPELTGSDYTANTLWVRYAQPVSIGDTNWLVRASLPLNSFPNPAENGDKISNIGDFNIFAAYLMDMGNPAISFGVGPLLSLPTAEEDILGSGKYSAGFANVLFNAESPKFQYGYLLTWQHSFAGDDERKTVNTGAFQPFAMYQLGGGTYLRSVGIWYYNFENDNYSVPVGFGIGQVFKRGKTVYNVYVEPQYSLFDHGDGVQKWQILLGFNMQFMGL